VRDGTGGEPRPQASREDSSDPELVVATPERVSFTYETANVGSRFVAQVIDSLVLLGLLLGLGAAALLIGLLTGNSTVPALLVLVGGLVILAGYFIVSEAVWSGQTLGKRAMRLRAVDMRGGPLSVGQAIVRNLVRIVDFLPAYYLAGAVAIFVTKRNQRLGDLAAGTVVVRERPSVRLQELAASVPGPVSQPRWRRRLDPTMRRFVIAYSGRRHELPPERRAELAGRVEPALRALLPDLVERSGALAALDQLADEEGAG
jgi:uncharacterized RDD family membrane protein YckC